MRRNEHVVWRAPHRGGDGSMCSRKADRARNVAIGNQLAEFELRNQIPDAHLQRRAIESEREIETLQPAREIGAQLAICLAKYRVSVRRGEWF